LRQGDGRMKTPKPLLNIGDIVLVSGKVEMYYEDKRRKMERMVIEPPVLSVICGATRRRLGVVHPGHHYQSLDGDDYDPGYLQVEKTVFVYQVRLGLMRKQFECLPEDVCLDQ
jgi:hypothetical protein